jgi:hypothetical protein
MIPASHRLALWKLKVSNPNHSGQRYLCLIDLLQGEDPEAITLQPLQIIYGSCLVHLCIGINCANLTIRWL